MDSRQRLSGLSAASFPLSAPLVVTQQSSVAAEVDHFKRLFGGVRFRVKVAFLRLRLGTPLTNLDERLISKGADLLSLLQDILPLGSAYDGVAPSQPRTGRTSS